MLAMDQSFCYDTLENKEGYFEDRRPASNMDPYLVTEKIFTTTVVEEKLASA